MRTVGLQTWLAIAYLVAGCIIAGVTNGDLHRPLNPVGAFASIFSMLMSIAISLLRV